MLGAEVVHVESITRPDQFRHFSTRAFSEDLWWEYAPNFGGTNTNKLGLTLDLTHPRGRQLAFALAATCDVVVENFSPRVMENFELRYEDFRTVRPDIIMVRMPGFGLSGPWRDATAFAQTIEDASGMTWITGYPDSLPEEPYSVCDPNSGLHAMIALLIALAHRRRTGHGALVEAPMIDAALNIAAEQVIEHSASGAVLQRAGNRGPTAAPQNIYRVRDLDEYGQPDSWVAIAVASDVQWEALRAALGDPEWARDEALATMAGRQAAHDTIDAYLAAWCESRNAKEVIGTLWPAGIAVGRVMLPHRQAEVIPLQERGFFEVVDHPYTGRARYDRFPARFSGGPTTFNRRRAPLLGEHTRDLLAEVGVTADEFDALEAANVTGSRPIWIQH
jgi:crotonobetainyl-CoA:carnitine CoA-transferase CaiB-like acyl-CoA transferase